LVHVLLFQKFEMYIQDLVKISFREKEAKLLVSGVSDHLVIKNFIVLDLQTYLHINIQLL
jgi:hypothetical protein